MERMIRKQVYIEPRQEAILKRIAKEEGVTEAEVVREAIELKSQASAASSLDRRARSGPESAWSDRQAWREAKAFMLELAAQGPVAGGRAWTREDLHDR